MALSWLVVGHPKRIQATLTVPMVISLACSGEPTFEPTIDSVQPSQIPFGVATNCTIRGQNLRSQLRVEVDSTNAPSVNRDFGVWIGAEVLPADLISPVNTTTLVFVAPPTLALGVYGLKLRTPAGRWATMPNALNVVAANPSIGDRAGNNTLPNSTAAGTRPGPDGGANGSGGTLGGATASTSACGAAGWCDVIGGGSGGQLTSSVDSNGGSTSGSGASGGSLPTGSSAGTSASASGTAGSSATTTAGGAGGTFVGAVAGRAGVAGTATTRHVTMWTDGPVLRDTCDQAVVLRGVQQILGKQLPPGNNWSGLIDEIAQSGANAVRIQVETATLSLTDVAAVVARIYSHNMIAIVSPDSRSWYSNLSVASSLAKYRSRLIFDAYYPSFDDRPRFLSDAKAAVAQIRGYGYIAPLLVSANAYGRDLPAALNYGAEIVASDPVHNIIVGWDAYWGDSGTYQTRYGMSLTQGIAAAAVAKFPILLGLTMVTDASPTNQYLDYETALTAAQVNGLGWLWWDFYNPYGTENNLSADGTSTKWTTAGERVINTHPAGLAHTTSWSCGTQ